MRTAFLPVAGVCVVFAGLYAPVNADAPKPVIVRFAVAGSAEYLKLKAEGEPDFLLNFPNDNRTINRIITGIGTSGDQTLITTVEQAGPGTGSAPTHSLTLKQLFEADYARNLKLKRFEATGKNSVNGIDTPYTTAQIVEATSR